ncbi:MAG: hypothetical protein ABH867_01075 [Patescibacteria group bacterium]|nr:hypothetical protein [Patescibacteria group bacterium]
MGNGRGQEYEPRQWFLKMVGGESASIPAQVGVPLTLRIHHREITTATGARPRMLRDLREIVTRVDRVFGYRQVLGRMLPPKRRSGNDGSTPAGQFFDEIALGKTAMQEYSQGIRDGVRLIIPDAPPATIAKKVAAVGQKQAVSFVVRETSRIFW